MDKSGYSGYCPLQETSVWTSARNDLTLAAFYQRVIAILQLMWKLSSQFCETQSLVTIIVYVLSPFSYSPDESSPQD